MVAMTHDALFEICMSISATTISAIGAGIGLLSSGLFLGQADIGSGIVGIVTQFGGLGVAVWLVIHHTTITIPNLQKEHREERVLANQLFKDELDLKRKEYLVSIEGLSKVFQDELKIRRDEFEAALDKLSKIVEKPKRTPHE